MFPERVDVAVAGGGMAGCICAARLAEAGASVALFHDAESPRSSVEMLSGRARWLFRTLGLPCPNGIELLETASLWGSDQLLSREALFDPYGPGLAVERGSLDLLLREHAVSCGAVRVPERVRSISRDAACWWVESRSGRRAAYKIVVATGTVVSSLIARRATVVRRQIAFLCRIADRWPARLWIEETSHGWWYALPVPDGGTFAGYCTDSRSQRTAGGGWFDDALLKTRLSTGLPRVKRGPIRGAPASVIAYDRAAAADWIAIGNAVFSPDPLCGDGVWFACQSAMSAADVVLGRTTSAQYQDWVDSAVWSHLIGRSTLPTT